MGGYPQHVVGKSSTQPTLFGVLGQFRGDQKFQGLQQVVERPSHYKLPPLHSGVGSAKEHGANSDRDILGHPAKTHIPGIHYGMMPFAGAFMSSHGDIEIYGREHHGKHHEKHHEMDEMHEEHKHKKHHAK